LDLFAVSAFNLWEDPGAQSFILVGECRGYGVYQAGYNKRSHSSDDYASR
jgi:hypothetical protein